MRVFLMSLLFIIGIVVGVFGEKYQIQNNRWDKEQLIGTTINDAIQILGLPDDRFPLKNTMLWINHNQILNVQYDLTDIIDYVSVTNISIINDYDIDYKFSVKRLLELNYTCKLESYRYDDTCEKRKKEQETLFKNIQKKD